MGWIRRVSIAACVCGDVLVKKLLVFLALGSRRSLVASVFLLPAILLIAACLTVEGTQDETLVPNGSVWRWRP
jgi:hypothetical protein